MMEKALFACDELAGFITAVALIKPGKSLAEVDTKSVRKRMKDKASPAKSVARTSLTARLDWGWIWTSTSGSVLRR
jgi:predicted hydrolase (HD superfamily)